MTPAEHRALDEQVARRFLGLCLHDPEYVPVQEIVDRNRQEFREEYGQDTMLVPAWHPLATGAK